MAAKKGRVGSTGNKFHTTLGLPNGAVMNCADNTGAKALFVIGVKWYAARSAHHRVDLSFCPLIMLRAPGNNSLCHVGCGAALMYCFPVCYVWRRSVRGRLNKLPAASIGDMIMSSVKKGKPELRKKGMRQKGNSR